MLVFVLLAVVFAGVLKLFGVAGRWPYAISVPLIGVVYVPLAWWTIIRRDIERSRWRSGRRRRRLGKVPWMAMFLGYLLPFAAAFMIVISAVDFGTTWPAAHGGGHPGTLVLQYLHCRKGRCAWSGSFRSDHGAIVRESVLMRDAVPASARAGDSVRARDTGNRSFVFAESGSFDWWQDILAIGLATAYLLGWGAFIFILIRKSRAGPRRGSGTDAIATVA